MDKDIFTNDLIHELQPHVGFSVNISELKMPKTKDWYFKAKWNDIYDQYTWARIFLRKAFYPSVNGIFKLSTEDKVDKQLLLTCSAQFYEIALLYYNIIVDLSWTLTYVSAEYIVYNKNGDSYQLAQHIDNILSLEDSYKLLRKAESLVTNPSAVDNPFQYLKITCPEFSDVINLIITFWSDFSQSSIRKYYNYTKHKGKLTYKEILDITPSLKGSIHIDDIIVPSSIEDVQFIINLNDSIQELINFDNNTLYPYIYQLIKTLEEIIEPSPLTCI